ncbi:hypothetical protein B2J86_17870 [Acidovorax sp. SRB_14]|uniref:hypothetical protein n=1 Tax=unclassified Acidovorax TaxID=2684926 RepID=UPI00145D705D|nr:MULTISPECIES: hypothetical protein [unclassified Acidovorax]NMM78627.1 hypothetical protein [Acidovorax sp. SRB_24]NMM82759.1 hypothetical protein [Acidovorax sp. SRB_14]NMM92651.1 hypothetical protein [Rhodococcus sp. SRB_17]
MRRALLRTSAAPGLARAAACACVVGALASPAVAAPPAQDAVWMAVADQTLDGLRGGFNMGDGLMVSFGISRAVFINGALITETSLNVGRVADLTPAQATQLSQKLETLSLVQNGPGNSFASGPSTTTSSPTATGPTVTAIAGATTGTFIQNSLNNQQIRYQTIINASSNGLGMVRSVNLHGTLADAIQQSIGQR